MEQELDEELPEDEQLAAAGGGWKALLARISPASLRRRFELPQILAASVAVVVLAALILSVVEWSSQSGKVGRLDSLQALQKSALQIAPTYGVYLSSYSYGNLNGPGTPWSQVDRYSTAAYRAKFDKTKVALSKLVVQYKASATGAVKAEGVTSVSSRQAVVLLYIVQTTTNATHKGPTTQPLVVQLVLARQAGKWLIGDLIVPS